MTETYATGRAGAAVGSRTIRYALVAAAALAAVAVAHMLTVIPYGRAIWDFLFVLDGSYRISLGEVPHVDFSSPIGALTLYFTYWGERLFPATNPFVGLHVVAWLATLPAVAALAPRFESLVGFILAFAVLALVMLVPVTVDNTILAEISYFATYNRFATGLLFLVGLWLVLPKRRGDWLLLAYLVTLLVFIKITAAVVAIGIVVYAVLFARARWATLAAALGALAVALVATELTTGIVSGYFADIREMSAVNRGGFVHGIAYAAYRNWMPVALTTVLALLAVWRHLPRAGGAVRAVLTEETFALDASLLVAAALFAESQNSGGVGLVASLALFFHPAAWQGRATRPVVNALLLAAILFPLLSIATSRMLTVVIREGRPMASHPIEELFPGTSVPAPTAAAAEFFDRVNTQWLDFKNSIQDRGYKFEIDPESNANGSILAWAGSAVDAAHIFEQRGYRELADSYITIGFADPFARMLKLRPAPGSNIVIDVGRTMPLIDFEAADAYLAAADGVFFSRCERRTDVDNNAVFQAVLDQKFREYPLNACWDFYQRLER